MVIKQQTQLSASVNNFSLQGKKVLLGEQFHCHYENGAGDRLESTYEPNPSGPPREELDFAWMVSIHLSILNIPILHFLI